MTTLLTEVKEVPELPVLLKIIVRLKLGFDVALGKDAFGRQDPQH